MRLVQTVTAADQGEWDILIAHVKVDDNPKAWMVDEANLTLTITSDKGLSRVGIEGE